MAKDPVCGMEIDENKAVFSSKYKGNFIISAPRVARLPLINSQRRPSPGKNNITAMAVAVKWRGKHNGAC